MNEKIKALIVALDQELIQQDESFGLPNKLIPLAAVVHLHTMPEDIILDLGAQGYHLACLSAAMLKASGEDNYAPALLAAIEPAVDKASHWFI